MAGEHRPGTAGTGALRSGRERASFGTRGGESRAGRRSGGAREPGASGEDRERDYTNRATRACNTVGVIKLRSQSHPQSHPRSQRFLSKPLIPLTNLNTYDPYPGPGKGSRGKRGATQPKTFGLRPRLVFLRHTCRAGRSPRKLSLLEGDPRLRRSRFVAAAPMRSERHAAARVHRVRCLAAGCRGVPPRSLDPHVEAPVHRPALPAAPRPVAHRRPTPPRGRRSHAPAVRSRHLTLGQPPKTDPYRTAGRATPSWKRQTVTSRSASIVRCRRTGPPQRQRIGQRGIMARCHRVSRRSSRATVRVAAADAERTSEANTRSTRPTRMTESPREMSGWFWSAVDASGSTSEGTSGSLNGRASRHRTGPRRSGANVRPGSRRLKRPNVLSVCSWTKCIRLWTTTFVYSPPSPRGPSLTAHHSCLELTRRLASRRNYVVSAPTAE